MIGTTRIAMQPEQLPADAEIGTTDQADDGVPPEQEHRDDEDEHEDPLGRAERENER